MDVNKQIRMAVKTGKVEFGSKSALSSASLGRAKLLILASNCPTDFRENIVYVREPGDSEVLKLAENK